MSRIDKDGIHLFGCQCDECTRTNRTCPECGTRYWAEPGYPQFEECHHCMWTPFKEPFGAGRSDDYNI